MQTRRDQLAAYRYLVRRVLASMLGNDPEAPEQPMRRVAGATGLSVLVAALVCGGIAGWGWLKGSTSNAWAKSDKVLVNIKGTGARFVYAKDEKTGQKVLREILNFTSAQLIMRDATPETVDISLRSLTDTGISIKKGPAIGIAGAPGALPAEKDLASSPWAVCSRPKRTTDTNQKNDFQTDVLVGRAARDKNTKDGAGKAIVVKTGSRQYLVWNGKRLPAEDNVLLALGLNDYTTTVAPAWVNALPQGDIIQAPKVSGTLGEQAIYKLGERDVTVGGLYKEEGSGDQGYWLAGRDKMQRLTQIQGVLLNKFVGRTPKPIASSVILGLDSKYRESDANRGDLPDEIPEIVKPFDTKKASVCLTYEDTTGRGAPPRLTVDYNVPDPVASDPPGLSSSTADHTNVDTGQAALVATKAKNAGSQQKYFIVTDTGQRFSVKDPATLALLGYTGAAVTAPVYVDELVLKLVPAGPGLSPEAAGAVAGDTATAGALGDIGDIVGN